MRARSIIVGLAAGWLLFGPAEANARWMSADELRTEFEAQTVDGVYPDGLRFEEHYAAGGALDYREAARTETGRWSTEDGVFCTIYDSSPTGGCYRVQRVGPNCFQFHFVSPSPMEARQRPVPRATWTARGWVRGRGATCDETPAV